MIDVIAAGHLCVDIIPTIDENAARSASFMKPGRLTEVGPAVFSTGGAVSNTGLALYHLGADVRLVARVGDDPLAALIRDLLRRHGPHLDETLVVGQGEASSYSVVISAPDLDRTFLHGTGTNDTFGPEDVSDALLSQTRLFHFGYPPLLKRMYTEGGRELETLLAKARAAGCTVSLDTSMPDPARASGQADWPTILARALPHVHIFVPSAEELLYMLDRPRYEAVAHEAGQADMLDLLSADDLAGLAQQAIDLGARVVLLKAGHRGAYLQTATSLGDAGRGSPDGFGQAWAGRQLWAPCFRVQVRGTVGAGDATIAGFLMGFLRGQAVEAALTSGVAVGACCVETTDATSGIRPWEDTQRRIAGSWDRLSAGPEDSGWRWDPTLALWHGPHDSGSA